MRWMLLSMAFAPTWRAGADEIRWVFDAPTKPKTLGELWDSMTAGGRPALVAVNCDKGESLLVDSFRTDSDGPARWHLYAPSHGKAVCCGIWIGPQPSEQQISERLDAVTPLTAEMLEQIFAESAAKKEQLRQAANRERTRQVPVYQPTYQPIYQQPFAMPSFGGGGGDCST